MSNWVNGNLTGKLSVGQGERGKSLEYEWRGTELGIRQEGEEEYQFVDLAGGGAGSGREVELQVGSGYIQWRYKGEESWNNLISIDSLKGGKGDKGEQGPQGLPGKDGADGTNGKDGVTPNIAIGTITTLEAGQQATVVKRGTIENPIFDFGIPKGEKAEIPSDGLVTTEIIGSTLTLTTDKYQKTAMEDNTTIVLPSINKFTEIHLFFTTTSELTLILPSCKWQRQPSIESGKTYEFIFTYADEWLGGFVPYE